MYKIIYIAFLLFSTIVHASSNYINVIMLKQEQTISKLLALQKTMPMSKTPKKLSAKPHATCFTANINDFLPANTINLKPIYGCVFSDRITMNAALLRAGLYVHTKTGIASDEQLFSSKLMNAVGGHDFNGEELFRYNNQVVVPNKILAKYKRLKNIEAEFDQKIIKPIINQNKENFIFFSIINTKKYKANLTHELLHAQYYNVPQIREVLLQVWNQVPPHDQQIIIKSLQDGGYDMNQQELLLREFYSYFLQYNSKNYLSSIKVLAPMAKLSKVYAPKIQSALHAANIKIVTLTNRYH